MLLAQERVSLQKVISDLVLDLWSSFLGLEGGERWEKCIFHVVQRRGSLARRIILCLDSRAVSGPGELQPRPCNGDSPSVTEHAQTFCEALDKSF